MRDDVRDLADWIDSSN